jgi:neutral ceramidase
MALGAAQPLIIGRHGLPEVAQLTAVRIGDMLIGTLPGEPTTTVGARIRAAMARAAGVSPDSAVLMGVTNGYIQYVTTREEYAHQFYEGAATEYGPGSAAFFQDALARLAATLHPRSSASRPQAVAPLTGYRFLPLRSLPKPAGPQAGQITRRLYEASWRGDTLVVRWNDVAPGRMVFTDTPMVVMELQGPGGWRTWDDDHEMEVRALRSRGPDGFEWEARWRPCRRVGGVTYRVILPARAGFPEVRSDEVSGGPAPGCIDEVRTITMGKPQPGGARG